jgi:glycosyltransferase involved in cell wall biosynthesis/MoaA/NifB/PqqE/SkfB family radical SAM enzyme
MILFWTPGGMPLLLHIEGVIAKALKHRGQDVHAVLCDGSYRACILREIQQNIPVSNWSASCSECVKNTSQTLDKMEIPYSYIGDFVSMPTREYLWRNTETISWDNLDGLQYENVPIGKNIQSAIIRYLQGCPLTGNEEVVREYAFSACMSAEAAKNAYVKLNVDKIVMSHGVYAEWGPALQTAWNLRIPVIAWMGSYLRCRFYFRQIEDNIRLDFHNMSREAWNACRQMDFSAEKEARLHQYQVDRYQKHISFDMKRFKEYSGQTESLRRKYAPLSDKPVWGIMAHINWDTVSDYSPMAYSSFDEWIKDTIQEISGITNVQWLVKVHPAESWDNPASGVQKLIEHNFPRLPAHIKVISAEEQISPLDFFNMIDGGITVYGTGGLELALQGKPVILAGESHYGGKGFTYDGLTTESYKQLLHKAGTLPQLNAEQLLLTKKYAYCYFIQRQIPVPVVMDPTTDWWCFQEQKAHLLLPGKDPFIDFLCDRIFDGQDFIMPENLVLLAEKVYDPESDVNNQPIDGTNFKDQNEIARLIEQVSVSIGAKDLSSAYTQISKFLADNSVNLDAAVRSDLHNTAVLLKAKLDKIVPTDTAPHEVSSINMKPILGFDPAGEVFTHNGRVYRGVFTGHGRQARAVYDLCLNRNLFAAGIVNTTLVNFAPFNQMGYDLVLEHERVPFISYAHEWTPSMLKDAALFQIDLDLQLLDSDLILKDCGATTNVLFDAANPVYVDFLSIVPVDKLIGEEWLAPDQTARKQYAGISQKCQYFKEVFKRMFFPGILLPLYITHQNKAETARKRLLQTALNKTGDTVTELETFADAPHHLHFAYQKYRTLQESALRNEDVKQYLLIQRHEIEELDVSTSQSDYADYCESKGEDFDFFPNDAWKPKQWGVFNTLQSFKPSTVLDIGANTGWFSILATKHGAKVVSLDNDVACMDILYRRAKQENLSILPLIVDFLDPTPDVSAMAELCREPHVLNSRFATDIPLLLSADKRIACDMVIALAIIHHLCLGGGRHLDEVTRQLALFAKKHLVLEFVTKEDPLIVGEPDFFKAQYANPTGFDWYSLETCLKLLGRYFGSIQQIPLTSSRILLVCTDKKEGVSNSQPDSTLRITNLLIPTPTNADEFKELKLVLHSPPTTYIVGVSNICNLQCPLCVTGLRQQKKKPQFMDFELFKQIIEKIRPHAQLVQLYKWGESLLHPHIIDMLALCDSYDLNTEISSNLSLENCDQILEALVRFRLRHLIVSFDGVTQEDYTRYRIGGQLDLVLANIRKIKEFKIRYNNEYPVISLQFLRNKFTGDQVKVIEENYRQWGADKYYVCDMTTVFKDRDLDAARQWFSEQEIAQRRYLDIDVAMHGKPCYFLYTTMIIEQDGSIPSCCFATDPKDDYGKWDNNKSILEMYNSDRFIHARRMFREKTHCSTSTCDDCCTFTTYMGKGSGVAVGRLPMVTVIIPSYNRADMIGITLESFVNQDYPKNRYEIIVADNNSTDSTKAVVLQWQAKSAVPIKYIFEQRQGVHYARNSAAKLANGEILYFTDDDMIAESDLLSELVKVFKIDPLVGSATGRVLPKWEVAPPEWILSLCNNFYLSLNDLGDETIIAEHDIGVFSCHQAMTREAFFKAGGFNPESTYTDYIGDGETGLNIKLKDLGYKFGYNGKSVIHHMIPPSRMTQDYLNKRLANQGNADCYTEYKKHRFSGEQLAERVREYVSHLIERSSLCVNKRLNGDVSWRLDKAKTHYYLNRIEYDIRLMNDPAWRELVLRDDWINE